MADKKTSAKHIGDHLRRLVATVIQRPLQWSQIDALATLEEKEEAQRRAQADKVAQEKDRDGGGKT